MSAEFVLRCCHETSNTRLSEFRAVAEGVHVSECEWHKEWIYQVYPGNNECTFYNLERNQLLRVYCVLKDETVVVCATHAAKDHYIYFQAPEHTTHIVVVKAHTTSEADALLQKHTKFSFT